MSKAEIRKSALRSRRSISRSLVGEWSKEVEANLVAEKEFSDARRVAMYVAKEDEVQTASLIERALSGGKEVAVPVVDRSSDSLLFFRISGPAGLSLGTFGIYEPKREGPSVPLSETDIVIVPLVAWDAWGHRVGYGKGYYDRALAGRGSACAVGLAFESQSVDHIPDTPSDARLDMLVTEKRTLRFGRSAA
jgi:5-formyltetrahydrofolate cyclo-ligase